MLGGSDFVLCKKSHKNQALGSMLSTWGLGALILYRHNHIYSIYNHIQSYTWIYIYIFTFFHDHLYSLNKIWRGAGFVCFRLRSVCFKLFCVLSFDVLWEVFGLHIFALFCVLSFDVLLEVFGLHCFVCCPLGSVWLPGDVPPPKDWWHSLGMYKIRAQPLYSTKPP